MPTERAEDIVWPHSPRLPLGGGWRGSCRAPGYEGSLPTSNELKEFCNLGYAADCPRLPEQRVWDAIRFYVLSFRGSQILLRYVGELGHRPVGSGVLEYNYFERRWTVTHPQAQVQRMAECYLQSYLEEEAKTKVSPFAASEDL